MFINIWFSFVFSPLSQTLCCRDIKVFHFTKGKNTKEKNPAECQSAETNWKCIENEHLSMGCLSKCDQICSILRIWSHFLKKSLMENFNFCAVMSEKMLRKFFLFFFLFGIVKSIWEHRHTFFVNLRLW